MHTFWKEKKCKTFGYLPWYYFVTIIINVIIIINLNILDIDIFSPVGNQHQVNNCFINFIIIIVTLKNKNKKSIYILCR